MNFSKYNIISKIKDSENYFIVNLLSQNADILTETEINEIEIFKNNNLYSSETIEQFIENKYIVEPKDEEKLYRKKYLDFIDNRETDEVQLFFVPNYSCNFACTYCFQDEYNNPVYTIKNEIVDAFFEYIKTNFANRKKYITVFGGEPLLFSPKQKVFLEYFFAKCNQNSIDISLVTNGYTVVEYMDLLKTVKIREIQITLDGTETVHNKRRFLKGGQPTFNKIVTGIDLCLENKINVNLRIVADKENIENLPELSQFSIDKKWTTSPYFKTQIGRNYELHHCQSSPDKLFSRVTLYEKIYELVQKYPHILEFYKPAFSISKFLSENNELPEPLFDSCPACKTEWAFDFTGKIYSCTATVGKSDEVLGTFYPEITKKQDIIEQWESRDVTEIEDCKTCNLQLACGGGCGSVAKNKSGNICSTDCRPITELLEIGFKQYFE